ncbi:hypothetical protein ASD04_16355 [Devosia sp. Root436]|uniref:thermonuclease family protein n=1 Tax=Devosia sp. Root436 TaxID=1736537 RepID=UPI0006F916C1|nr:thermonuclease family protein [Devosia sp. Root436]KQX34948.1 hypothetical protein ASD04_16355 [Devosia sp. Root436]
MRPVLAALLASLALGCVPAMAAEGDTVTGPGRTIDADIIMVDNQRVILWGVDAPERDQICTVGSQKWACWDAAKQALDGILARGDATCVLTGVADPFGRSHGTCTIDGMDVGEAFVGTGMARAYLDQTDAYLAAEEAAKAAGLGVWQAGAKVDDPWAWRKRNPGGFR